MDEHLFTRSPWIGYVTLVVLSALLVWRVRAALSMLRLTQEDLDRGSKEWAISRGPSLVLTCLLWMLPLIYWMFTEGKTFFLGDLIAGLAILILPPTVEGWLRTKEQGMRDMAKLPLLSGGYLGCVLLNFGNKNPVPWTWPDWCTVASLVPLGLCAFCTTRRDIASMLRSWTVLMILPIQVGYLFLAFLLTARVLEGEALWGIASNLHDSLGLVTVLVSVWITRLAIRRSRELNGAESSNVPAPSEDPEPAA